MQRMFAQPSTLHHCLPLATIATMVQRCRERYLMRERF